MGEINYIVPEKISLLNHPILNEKWVQERIAENPSILGLDYHEDLVLKDKERIQPKGRLDLLLHCNECGARYETEVQLGTINESHIIRTIEYWDIERKKSPKYDHYAVIIAEDVTSRFLNVLGLLNRTIPLIVIKMEAYRYQNNYWLNFTTVLDETDLEFEDEETDEIVDRVYWENISNPKSISLMDELISITKEICEDQRVTYNKHHVALGTQKRNFIWFHPRKKEYIYFDIRVGKENIEKVKKVFEESDVSFNYKKEDLFGFRLHSSTFQKYKDLVKNLFQNSYEEYK